MSLFDIFTYIFNVFYVHYFKIPCINGLSFNHTSKSCEKKKLNKLTNILIVFVKL